MAVLVRCGHPFSASEMLHLLQKKYGCTSVRTKGPEWFLLETNKGNFEVRVGELRMNFESEGFVGKLESILKDLQLDSANTKVEMEGVVELPFISALKFEMKKGFLDILKTEEDVFWKRHGEDVFKGVTDALIKNRAFKDGIKRRLSENVINKDGIILHCIYTWDSDLPKLSNLPAYFTEDDDYLTDGSNFKCSISGVNLSVNCNLDLNTLRNLTQFGPNQLMDYRGVPIYFTIYYDIKAHGKDIKKVGDATRVVFDGMEPSFAKICEEQGFVRVSLRDKKLLDEAKIFKYGPSSLGDKKFVEETLEIVRDWCTRR